MVLFVCFILLFLVIKARHTEHNTTFRINDALRVHFLDQDMPTLGTDMTFDSVRTLDQLWEFLEGPLLRGLYPTEWYNGQAYTEEEKRYILNYLKLIGKPRLRQARVIETTCGPYDEQCYPSFEVDLRSLDPYGPDNRFTATRDLVPLWGWARSYGDAAFIVDLPRPEDSSQNASDIIASLKQDMWIDKHTSVVATHFLTYNAATSFLTWNELLFEFYSTGHIQPQKTIRSFRAFLELTTAQYVFIVLTCMYVLGFFIQWADDVQQRKKEGMTEKKVYLYFISDVWNILDMCNLALFVATIVLWIFEVHTLEEKKFRPSDIDFKDYTLIAIYLRYENALSAFNVILSCVKIFQYLRLNSRLSLVWNTLARCVIDMVVIFICFLVLMFGFAFAGYLLFGHAMYDFRNLQVSCGSLARVIMGDFDYRAMTLAERHMAPLFMVAFVGLVVIVVFNLFIAVIVEAFEDAQDEQDKEKETRNALAFQKNLLGVNVGSGLRKKGRRMHSAFQLLKGTTDEAKGMTWRDRILGAFDKLREKSGEEQLLEVFSKLEKEFREGTTSAKFQNKDLQQCIVEELDSQAENITSEKLQKMKLLVFEAVRRERAVAAAAQAHAHQAHGISHGAGGASGSGSGSASYDDATGSSGDLGTIEMTEMAALRTARHEGEGVMPARGSLFPMQGGQTGRKASNMPVMLKVVEASMASHKIQKDLESDIKGMFSPSAGPVPGSPQLQPLSPRSTSPAPSSRSFMPTSHLSNSASNSITHSPSPTNGVLNTAIGTGTGVAGSATSPLSHHTHIYTHTPDSTLPHTNTRLDALETRMGAMENKLDNVISLLADLVKSGASR